MLESLSQKTSLHKRRGKLSKHKYDWQTESVALEKAARSLETDILGSIQKFASAPEDQRDASVHQKSLQHESISSSNQSQHDLKLGLSQSRLRRQPLHERRRSIDKRKNQPPSSALVMDFWNSKEREEWQHIEKELAAQSESLQRFQQDLMGQVLGMNSVVKNELDQQHNTSQLHEIAQVLRIIRENLAAVDYELFAAARATIQETVQSKSAVARAMRESRKEETSPGEDDSASNEGLSHAQSVQYKIGHLVAGYENVPSVSTLVGNANEKIEAVVSKHAKEAAALQERIQSHKKVHESGEGEATVTKDETYIREALAKVYRETVLRGRGLGLFTERAQLQVPEASHDRIDQELVWMEERRQLTEQRRNIARTFARSIAIIYEETEKKINDQIATYQAALTRQGEKEEIEIRRAEIQARLDIQRHEAAIRAAEEAEAKRVRDEIAREEEEQRLALFELERERKHRLVAELQKQRAFDAAMQALHDAQYDERLLEMQRARAPENKKRVDYREEQRLLRLQEQQVEIERARIEAAVSEQKLAQLKKTVPYYGKLQEIVPSRDRLEQHTFSSAVVPDAAYHNYAREGLFQNPGFTDAQVCGDVRFRVVEALRAQGLQNSSYAHSLLKSMASNSLAQKNLTTNWG